MKKSNDTIGNRTRDLPACSVVPQPTAPPRSVQGTSKKERKEERKKGRKKDRKKEGKKESKVDNLYATK